VMTGSWPISWRNSPKTSQTAWSSSITRMRIGLPSFQQSPYQ
jgi:hypothetical protein